MEAIQDAISIIGLILYIIVFWYLYIKRQKIQEKYDTRTQELTNILEAMKNASTNGSITSLRPTDELVRLVFSEYLKVYLQRRLDERIDDLNKRGMPAPGMRLNAIVEDEMKISPAEWRRQCLGSFEVSQNPQVLEDKSGKKFIKHATKI